MDNTRGNVLLVLMRLDLNDPLHSLETRQGEGTRSPEASNKGYQLLAAVLDPSELSTGAPVAGISLTGPKLDSYTHILESFQRISTQFYREGGFIDEPESYTNEKQREILEDIARVGRNIFDLFQTEKENPVRAWLAKLLDPYVAVRSVRPVTIITNDFAVPWFWLKRERYGPFLCEVCPLGIQQLSAAIPAEGNRSQPGRKDKIYDALVLKGGGNLPFLDEELDNLKKALTGPKHGSEAQDIERLFNTQCAGKLDDIPTWNRRQKSSYRLVHFTGHYSSDELILGDKSLPINFLRQILNGSLLVLDGCSSGREPDAWADVMGLTSGLLNEGTLGCVVTALPVKHDPIISEVLWGEFYGSLRRGAGTIGEALLNARLALKSHFQDTGSANPAWATYQLIGSPMVQFRDGEEERDDEWS